MKKSKKSNRAIIVLVVLLIALAIGYAAFQTVLTVDGNATGANVSWDVHFKTIKLYEVKEDGSRGSEVANPRATVSLGAASTDGVSRSQTATVSVNLDYPGDKVILETVIENLGSLDAKLTAFNITGASNGLVVTRPDDDAITTGVAGKTGGDVITAQGGTCTAEFLVKWDDTTKTFGDSTNHKQDFDITFTYSQNTLTKSDPATLTHSDS